MKKVTYEIEFSELVKFIQALLPASGISKQYTFYGQKIMESGNVVMHVWDCNELGLRAYAPVCNAVLGHWPLLHVASKTEMRITEVVKGNG